jgi:hypothetical protein
MTKEPGCRLLAEGKQKWPSHATLNPSFSSNSPFALNLQPYSTRRNGYFPMATPRDSSAILKWHHHSNSRAEQDELFFEGGPSSAKKRGLLGVAKALELSNPPRIG